MIAIVIASIVAIVLGLAILLVMVLSQLDPDLPMWPLPVAGLLILDGAQGLVGCGVWWAVGAG